jgi:hypothetical protein
VIFVVLALLVVNDRYVKRPLWDWLQLLIVPAVLAAGGIWFNSRQQKRAHAITQERARDEALQAYLDQIARLLPDKDSPLRESGRNAEVRILARAWTLTVLNMLDGIRKGSVLQFLYESGLIVTKKPVVSLIGADLSNTDLSRAHLRWADRLEWSTRKGTFRIDTPSMWVDLRGVNLSEAYLNRARLRKVVLAEAIMSDARLPEADLSEADLSDADLQYAALQGADLRGANLSGADLRAADLTRADLSAAELWGYPSRGTFGHARVVEEGSQKAALVSDDQLTSCKRLTDATMPSGQKYEDWLKSKGPEKDGDNSSPS